MMNRIRRIFAINLNRRTIVALVIIGILALAVVATGLVRFELEHERIKEFADLQAMRNAELTALTMQKNHKFKEGVKYWYDAGQYRLIEAGDSRPGPYGKGSRIDAGVAADFNTRYGGDYRYDGAQNYHEKLIQLSGESDETGKLRVELAWVDG